MEERDSSAHMHACACGMSEQDTHLGRIVMWFGMQPERADREKSVNREQVVC